LTKQIRWKLFEQIGSVPSCHLLAFVYELVPVKPVVPPPEFDQKNEHVA
jgi:hypothetical protein